ncbi:CLUMA_CG017110, isoform A [Clunio marinus]|uniref:CLUMA_CG017110, isoform A n=1 Tax=Clunio marinus TaxID=568069 RepID=A0A1J1IUY1_9DIPT|nr:CLUMA_CG017110, isoform A [Clunio marinus]
MKDNKKSKELISNDKKNLKKTDRKLIINPLFFIVIITYFVTRILQVFTGTQHFWSRLWNKIIDVIGDEPFGVYVVWTTIFSFCVYWIFGSIFTFMDLTLSPKSLRKYKVQPNTNEAIDKKTLFDAIKVILFNQIFVGIPLAYFGYYVKRRKGFPENFRDVPGFERVVLDLIVCILVDEIGFYYSHRLFHKGFFYKHIHKQHHLWQSPIAITATYCHPIEHMLSNVLPVAGGSMIMQSHTSVQWIWITIAILTTLNNHSGYHLPFSHSSEFHDFHHLKFVECFGKLGLLDRLHNTDKLFRETINSSRHRVLFSLKSARERYPDRVVKKTL